MPTVPGAIVPSEGRGQRVGGISGDTLAEDTT